MTGDDPLRPQTPQPGAPVIDIATLLLGVALAGLTPHATPLRALDGPSVGHGYTDATCGYVDAPCESPAPVGYVEVLHAMHALAERESEYRRPRATDRAVADAIATASAETGVEWIDLVIVGWWESRWTPTAVSSAGACGVWQVRSALAISTRPTCTALQDPLFGARYAARLLIACSGETACYAAGATGSPREWAQDYARRHARTRMEVSE